MERLAELILSAVRRILAALREQQELVLWKLRKLQGSVSECLSWCHSPHVLALFVDLKPSSILPAAGPPMPRDACPGDESFSCSDLKPDRRPNSDRRFENTLRMHLLLVATFLTSCSYSIGLSTPGGCWDETRHHSYSNGSSDDVDFPASGGIDVTFGSHTLHVLRHLSIHNPLIQVLMFALKRFVDTFACVKSMVPRRVFDMARILRSYAAPNVCGSEWISGKPSSESPFAVFVSEFNPQNGIHRSPGLTENGSQHLRSMISHPDSYGKPTTWIISTAAPHHATGNRAHLSGVISKHDDLFVHAVDETPMQVVACGTVVTDEVTLPDVWLVPGLTVNMLSVSQLVGLDYSVEFGHGMCYIRQRASDGSIVGKAHLRNRLYVLDFLKVPLTM